jgi:hypothetical protein
VNALHGCLDNGQATGFGREGINLIGALANMAKEAFNGIRRANRAMHDLWARPGPHSGSVPANADERCVELEAGLAIRLQLWEQGEMWYARSRMQA